MHLGSHTNENTSQDTILDYPIVSHKSELIINHNNKKKKKKKENMRGFFFLYCIVQENHVYSHELLMAGTRSHIFAINFANWC